MDMGDDGSPSSQPPAIAIGDDSKPSAEEDIRNQSPRRRRHSNRSSSRSSPVPISSSSGHRSSSSGNSKKKKSSTTTTTSSASKKRKVTKRQENRVLNPSPYFYYIDHSHLVDDDPLTPLATTLSVPNFVVKLHAILIRDSLSDVISWMPHGRSWRILNQSEFEKKVLPTYYNQSSIASFYRQANGWGFRRMLKGPDKGSFYNERFLRGMPFLSKKMKRIGGVKDVDASINNEPLLQKISDIHPPPQAVPRNTLDYLVLSTINRCIQEEGPKAKMPFVPGPPLAQSSSRKRKAESSDSSKLPATSVPPSTLAASSNDSLSSLDDHQEESQEESNTAAYPNTQFGQTHNAGDLIQQHQPPPHQPQQLNNPLLLANQAVDQNQQQMQSQNQSQQQMNSLLLQIMMAGTNPAAAALVPNSQNQLLGTGGVPTLPFILSNYHGSAPPSQQDHSSHAQVAQPQAQIAQAQATQAIVAASILQAYQQQAQQMQAGMLGSGIPNLTSATSRGSMQPQANMPNLNMLLAASMNQGGNTIPPQANVQNLNVPNAGQYSSAAAASNSVLTVPTASASNATSDPTQASAAALFSQLSNTAQVQQPPVQDYATLMNNMIQSQNLYNPVVHAPQLQFQQNPLASSFAGLTAPIQPPIQQQPPNQQQQIEEQSSTQQIQEDPQEERPGKDQDDQ